MHGGTSMDQTNGLWTTPESQLRIQSEDAEAALPTLADSSATSSFR